MRLVTANGRIICHYTHTGKTGPNGTWTRGNAPETAILLIQGNGIRNIKLRCTHCKEISGAVPHKVAESWNLAEIITEERIGRSDQKCVVTTCTSHYVEHHHFAPRNTFGSDADQWPVMPLCRAHHHEWHAQMDGYQWHKRAAR